MDDQVIVFSYGTLRQRDVQLSVFGREISGTPDRLPGYRLAMLEITDPHVIAISGATHHPILSATGDPGDLVEGTALRLTPAELAAADAYEVGDYRRALVPLASGLKAWVYAADHGEREDDSSAG
ncbi:gamma-glutamylcyclotransferase family protein [Nonomuraea rubra]|uniref:gamma-glutamylcyclotransferase family protein n=1 Tax=Nonomuraea rubra TaxID=46180 RepID=UPI0033C065F9